MFQTKHSNVLLFDAVPREEDISGPKTQELTRAQEAGVPDPYQNSETKPEVDISTPGESQIKRDTEQAI